MGRAFAPGNVVPRPFPVAGISKLIPIRNPGTNGFRSGCYRLLDPGKLLRARRVLDALVQGLLTTKDEYRALYVSYINADRDKDAVKVIEDGVAKGIIPASAELSKDYMVLGQKAYYNEDSATAIEMYKRAMPMAADGEAALNLANLYAAQGKTAEAGAAAREALEKGVKDTAGAKKLAGGK